MPNKALQRTEAGGRRFSVFHVHPRQPPSLSLEALGPNTRMGSKLIKLCLIVLTVYLNALWLLGMDYHAQSVSPQAWKLVRAMAAHPSATQQAAIDAQLHRDLVEYHRAYFGFAALCLAADGAWLYWRWARRARTTRPNTALQVTAGGGGHSS